MCQDKVQAHAPQMCVVLEQSKLPELLKRVLLEYLHTMGIIWWGTGGTCPPHFFTSGEQNIFCPYHFFTLILIFFYKPNLDVACLGRYWAENSAIH